VQGSGLCVFSGYPLAGNSPYKHLIGSFFIGTAVHHLVEMADVRGKAMGLRRSSVGALAAAALFGSIVGTYTPARAGSDRSTDTYAGDYAGGSLPSGTFAVLQYLRYAGADAFITPAGQELPNSHANIFVEFTRFAYITQLDGHPFVIEADLPFATLKDVNIPGTNNRVAGGLLDPDIHLTYFLTADPEMQRWLGFTNYFFFPLGRGFENQKAVNVSTARQFTDIAQIGYTEGLAKISPALNGVFFDLIANAAIHTNGNSPLTVINPASAPVPGVLTYDTLIQRPSYDLLAYLRYQPQPLQFVAIGIEKLWGGEQIATNGTFTATGLPIIKPQDNLPLSKDELLRGHFQFQIPFGLDFAAAADVFHDFNRTGGFRENIGVEIRLLKLFVPPLPLE
jgi:hypothetical protein